MVQLPFFVESAPISPAFSGTPQQFWDHGVARLRIVGPSGFYGIVVSDTEPTSNQGLWLKGGTKPYVWDDDVARYVPMDLTDSLASIIALLAELVAKLAAGRIIFSDTAPVSSAGPPEVNNHTNVVWARTSGGVVAGFYTSADGTTWVRVPSAPSLITGGGTATTYTGTSGDPDVTSSAQLLNRVFFLIPIVDNVAPTTFNYQSFGAAPMVKEGSKALASGDLRAGMRVAILFDGTNWQVLSPVYFTPATNTLRESAQIAIPAAGGEATYTYSPVLSAKPTDWSVSLICTTLNNGWPVGREIDISAVEASVGANNEQQAFTPSIDATAMYVRVTSGSSANWTFLSNTDGSTVTFPASDWRLVFRAQLLTS